MRLSRIAFYKLSVLLGATGILLGCGLMKLPGSDLLQSVKRADDAYSRQDYDQAARIYSEVIMTKEFELLDESTKFYAFDKLAFSYTELGKVSEAETTYRRKLSIVQDPKFADPYRAALIYEQVAIFFANQKQCDEANGLFRKSIELRKLANQTSDLGEALDTFKSILQIKGCDISFGN